MAVGVSTAVIVKTAAKVASVVGMDENGKFSVEKLVTVVVLAIAIPLVLIFAIIAYVVTLPFAGILGFVVPEGMTYENIFPEKVLYEEIGQYPMPCNSTIISSPFGNRDNPLAQGNLDYHYGIDFAASRHSSVIAIADGIVIFSGYKPSYGRCVIVKYDEFTAYYAHLAFSYAIKGAKVSKGMVLGGVGGDPKLDTLVGDSTGSHLHFEIRENGVAIDPYPFLLDEVEKKEENEDEIIKLSRTG